MLGIDATNNYKCGLGGTDEKVLIIPALLNGAGDWIGHGILSEENSQSGVGLCYSLCIVTHDIPPFTMSHFVGRRKLIHY